MTMALAEPALPVDPRLYPCDLHGEISTRRSQLHTRPAASAPKAMLKIQVNLTLPRRTLYLEALTRMHGVEAVEKNADALITDTIPDQSLPFLLDHPHKMSFDQLRELQGAPVMPAHQWRYAPNVVPLQESRLRGQLGDPGLLRIHHWLTAEACPAAMAFHQVDLSHWFFSGTPSSRHAHSGSDYLQLHLGYPDSGMSLIDIATNRNGSNDYYSMHLIGSHGAAYADDHDNGHLLLGKTGMHSLIPPANEVMTLRNMLEEFVNGIRENRPWDISPKDTLNALKTVTEEADA